MVESNRLKNYIIVALITALIVLGIVWIRDSSRGSGGANLPTPSAGGVPSAQAPVAAPPSVVTSISTDGNYVKGEANAPVTIIEFSDFQCPFCARFFTETLSQIETNYIKTGKVKFVYKDFPLESIHPNAMSAALAARCAGEQDKFWEMHDTIFTNQGSIGIDSYKAWAASLKLDTAKFNECLTSQKYISAVRKDLVDGQQAGVQGTPAFLINGQLISGAQPFAAFQQAIETALVG